MKKYFLLILNIGLFIIFAIPVHALETTPAPSYHKIQVPFTSEIPDGKWVAPWNNACEEASIIMIEQYYLGKTKNFTAKEAKDLMLPLFAWEDKMFGSNKDTDSKRTAQLINEYSSFKATIKTNPTLEEIKNEIVNNRPVISLHYGFGLNNPLLHFRSNGSSYHMMIIIGFDEEKQEFITHDPGHQKGLDERYSYATIMDTLHDFDHERLKADGPPTVLFTEPVILAKTKDSPAVYLIENNQKFPIAHSGILKARRWSWKLVKKVEQDWLDQYETGPLME